MAALLGVLALSALVHLPGAAQSPPAPGARPPAPVVKAARPKVAAKAVARGAEVRNEDGRTRFLLSANAPVAFSTYTLDAPYRVVIDIADLEFALPAASGQSGGGLIKSYRFGLLAPGRARVILDIGGPMRVEAAQLMSGGTQGLHYLVVDIVGVEEGAFQRSDPPSLPAAAPAPAKPAKPSTKPVVMIDPGHGGIDSGTQGTAVLEKDIVLQVSLLLRRYLLASGAVDVHMTRTGDTFVSLDERLRRSSELESSLFISIHADSIGAIEFAQSVRGATVYTLSERASDEAARALAEKENSADARVGIDAGAAADKDQVLGILFDLMRRDTAEHAAEFQSGVIANLGRQVALAKDPRRSAAFKVLKQPQSPSVLIELGYMSNAEDEALMRTADWQKKVAQAIAKAVTDYFARRAK
ncbi:MAG TPA: N-acetylmuramoyl-L-alanine amidase [Hyphomicrobiaceae bacterium]|nr:N-acetylmuramoyl-L-alanine amidase [Hyphomicrobiaceae bacterium]